MKMYGEVLAYVEPHAFLELALDAGERSASRPDRFIPEERAPYTQAQEARWA